MTKQEYEDYQARVASTWKDVEHVSSGGIPSCADCFPDAIECPHCEEFLDSDGKAITTENLEPWCSSSSCDICGDPLQGNRYPVHGLCKGDLVHYDACDDCVYYTEYGRLDDAQMESLA